MRKSLLGVGASALMAVTALAQIPQALHQQDNRLHMQRQMKDAAAHITEAPVPMVLRSAKNTAEQALTYQLLYTTDFYPFFEMYNTNRTFFYDAGTDAVITVRNNRTFAQGSGQLEGGQLRVYTSNNDGASWTETEILNKPGTVVAMPNLGVANGGTTSVNELLWSILGLTYEQSAGWALTSSIYLLNTASGLLDFPGNGGPQSSNPSGFEWYYGDIVSVNGDAPTTHMVSQLRRNNAGQYGTYGTWTFDYSFEDFTVSTIPTAWDVSQFRNPGTLLSTYNSAARLGADEEGRLYMVVNNLFADDENNRVAAVSTSDDQGTTWSNFDRMPTSALNAYATAQGWENIFVYRAYDQEALAVTGIGKFSYFLRVASSDAEGNLAALDIVEIGYDNGAWSVGKVASLNGIPLEFSRQDSLSQIAGGQYGWVPSYAVASQGHEIDVAVAADGGGLIVKWIDENPDLGYQQLGKTQSAYFFSQQNGQWVESQFDSLLTTDVYYAVKPAGGSWQTPVNITRDIAYDKGTRIPAIVPSLERIPFMSLKTITKAQYNPSYPFLPAIQQIPDLILDASVHYATPNQVQYTSFNALNPSSVNEEGVAYPFALNTIAPNPAAVSAEVTFTMDVAGMVAVDVFSTTGVKVATVYNGELQSGIHGVTVNTNTLASGTYYVALSVNGQRLVQPLTVVR